MSKKITMPQEVKEKVNFIKDFAKNMGYDTYEDYYTVWKNNRPAYSIELGGTSDIEGNPYSWAWYTDNWEEMF